METQTYWHDDDIICIHILSFSLLFSNLTLLPFAPAGRPHVELCRGRVSGGVVWKQFAPDSCVWPGGGRIGAAARGHHRGLGGQKRSTQR